MRLAYLSAGAGSLVCGACAYDFLIVMQLRRLAHHVQVLPLYTPVHTDLGEIGANTPVYLGGISAYLRASMPHLAQAASYLRPILDSNTVLNLATRGLIETDPKQLGALTQSVLEGKDGPHAKEFARILSELRKSKPEVVLLANTLFAPIATLILQELNIPVLASFQGEDSFTMDLPEPHRTACIALLRQHARSFQCVICPSQAAAQQAAVLLELPGDRFAPVPTPVDWSMFSRKAQPAAEPLTIGHVSVLRPAKGLDLLLRGMAQVADAITRPIRLLIAGQVVNPSFAKEARELASTLPAHVQVEFLGQLTLEQKIALLHACHMVCLPSRIPEARALAALEAMASGVPVVAPSHGSFPELLDGGAGWLYPPGDVAGLAQQLITACSDRAALMRAGTRATIRARSEHDGETVARRFEELLRNSRSPSPAN